jgi:hypothetical protein
MKNIIVANCAFHDARRAPYGTARKKKHCETVKP